MLSVNTMNGEGDNEFMGFLSLHAGPLHAAGVPQIYWKTLHHKLNNEIYDAGEVFGIMNVTQEKDSEDDEEKKANTVAVICSKVVVTRDSGLQASDTSSIFLVDHAWTYRVDHARQQLEQVPGLLARMAALMEVDFHGEVPDVGTVELVMEHMWKYNQTYHLNQGSAEEKVPVWYIMDEFGCKVQHSDHPSCAMVPFFYIQGQLAYSLLWPLQDLQKGDEVTRDYTYGETNPLVKRCRLLPWIPGDLEEVNIVTTEPPDAYYENVISENKEQLPVEIKPSTVPQNKIFKVYSEMLQVTNNLTHPGFQITEEEEEADILWKYNHIKDYRTLSEKKPHVMLNQFPCESLVTVKDCLAAVARRVAGGPSPAWLPETFNLQIELPQFIKNYQQRQKCGEDNHWICKPWNLARGLDTHITNNLDYIIRQRESIPKVVCKYIENPVLFNREEVGMVKFDIRYMLMLRSVEPLRLYTYNIFWLRFANRLVKCDTNLMGTRIKEAANAKAAIYIHLCAAFIKKLCPQLMTDNVLSKSISCVHNGHPVPFFLDHFDDYQKHFTVMNYAEGVELKQVHFNDFIPMFEKQYPQITWKEIEAELFKAFKELFMAVTCRPPPYGICPYPSSRAIYAVDLMLKWSTGQNGEDVMQPQILELNFSPDCERACQYHPSFYNHIFQTLFLDQPENCPVTQIV